MKMEFIFDKNKLKKAGYKEEQCFNAIRKHFDSYNSKTIRETKAGVFEGNDDDWNAFASAVILPHTKWFLKVIKEWYWYVDEEDGNGEQKEDCLESYYKMNAVHA
ncbi:MAG: hypothetical protein IJH76_01200 [Clostridia bacterium]|nr:hypothetical protein [Clostridia bacterium]